MNMNMNMLYMVNYSIKDKKSQNTKKKTIFQKLILKT